SACQPLGSVRENSAVPPGLESFLPLFPALKCVRENYSFAPLGLHNLPLFTHGLRRGLHSYAASRLKIWSVTPPRRRNSSSHAHTEALRHPKSKLTEFFRSLLGCPDVDSRIERFSNLFSRGACHERPKHWTLSPCGFWRDSCCLRAT